MSEAKKIIAVVGATGSQGGGLARAILADHDGPFALRALTRDVGSPGARRLADAGAEVVAADLDDERSVRSAFEGAYGAFVVTNFWAPRPEWDVRRRSAARMEQEQAGNAARAARAAGLRHVIWSTLEDTRETLRDAAGQPEVPVLEGDYTVPHFDAKAEADRLFTAEGVPTTFLRTTFFYEAFLRGMGPVRAEDGTLVLTLPMADARLAGIASDDIGRTALGVFRHPELIGRTVSIAGSHHTGAEIAGLFTAALGEQVHYRPAGLDEYRASGAFAADEVANMFAYYVKAADVFTGDRDLDAVRALNPGLQSLPEWLARHAKEVVQ
ncbi:NmrA/HSCARG family protein [Streptomyces clavuligerus]|uniref:NmrA family protein n=1 Tax=Streptomyces clavuligerus TaxID=1901 RepID=B5H2N1_STRCL|nr:NmrA/HSCARG family protein [Streptomyces clavuligerus]EDY52827.1 NmrA family protein [Streptomyces clavuligerus]EFG04167.1 NmrA family protein [Streptomyces clavuligerus]MBY6307352.1 NmrA/HSCARG family protein [Streptomyces clavuligerus]QCS10084.1 NmrA/HSCARG family protein [Streptomyces clavuligerus]QPJ97871.1 NAD(P)H-binding protein [Streptomyces clavuligerus]